MSRHTKNNTANQVFTYYERSIYNDVGTIKERLGADSMRKFEHCWLCLRTAQRPVATREGVVFCRSCIILNLGTQKEKMEKQRRIWMAEKSVEEEKEKQRNTEEGNKHIRKFFETEESVLTSSRAGDDNAETSGPSTSSSFNQVKTTTAKTAPGGVREPGQLMERDIIELRKNSFWISQNAPEGVRVPAVKPKSTLECPVTGKPLRIKDLIEIKPELLDDDNQDGTRWICCLSKKVINHQKAVVCKLDGRLMLKEYAEKFELGKKHNGGKLPRVHRSDFIDLLPGGTGFARHNKVEASIHKPMMGGN